MFIGDDSVENVPARTGNISDRHNNTLIRVIRFTTGNPLFQNKLHSDALWVSPLNVKKYNYNSQQAC